MLLFSQFDLVYVTGDLPAHNDWSQSRQDQLFVLNTIANLMKQYLPSKSVYFTFGNHEGFPVNRYSVGPLAYPNTLCINPTKFGRMCKIGMNTCDPATITYCPHTNHVLLRYWYIYIYMD